MFFGEILCLFAYFVVKQREKKKLLAESLYGEIDFNPNDPDVPPHLKNKIFSFVFAIPAFIDTASTTLQGIGLLYIDASVWQMMRGSLIIFAGILAVIFLKKPLRCFQWVGILFNVCGLCLVGVSSVFKTGDSSRVISPLKTLLGVFLVLLGALGTASQMTVEEKLLKGRKYHPLHVVGMEGIFGFLLTGCIAIPIVHFIPGDDLNGSYENFADAIFMMFQSALIFSMVVLSIFSIAFFNFFGLMLTKHLSAVHRTLFDTIRTIFIWFTGLIVYYGINKQYGEAFDTQWGLIQSEFISFLFFNTLVDGFALLIIGTCIYNKILKLDWIKGCERVMSTEDTSLEASVDITISNPEEDLITNRSFTERTPLLSNGSNH
ncbi:hypothetical protein Ciccas_003882 [Cichlidogyrus casuarinus]|uniref:Solute carrier family 35 member F6 n=1 Tax=Cichlidogyrus casuarinus TaxID=1844966 RepID=A0ABD2QD35_9PLAT